MIRYRPLLIFGLLPILLLVPGPVSARQATPATGCDIAPRTTDELGVLTATPMAPEPATPALAAPNGTPVGEPVDAATIAELDQTLQLTTNCASAGDLLRLLALYSDRFIVEQILEMQSAPIVPGTPVATPSYIVQIPPPVGAQPEITQAYLQADGRVMALVRSGDRTEMIAFVHDARRHLWQIDEIVPVIEFGTPSASPVAGHDQPAEVMVALADASAHLGVDQQTLKVTRIEAKTWPDAALGCPQAGHFYAQVVTPGYLVVIQGDGHELEYHTDQRGNIVLCHERAS